MWILTAVPPNLPRVIDQRIVSVSRRRAHSTRRAAGSENPGFNQLERRPLSTMSFDTIALVYVLLSIAACLFVAADIVLVGRRQPMGVMDAVWPLTLLYWGPLGLPFYFSFGRAALSSAHITRMGMGDERRCGRRCSRARPIAARAARLAISPPNGSLSALASRCSARRWRRG